MSESLLCSVGPMSGIDAKIRTTIASQHTYRRRLHRPRGSVLRPKQSIQNDPGSSTPPSLSTTPCWRYVSLLSLFSFILSLLEVPRHSLGNGLALEPTAFSYNNSSTMTVSDGEVDREGRYLSRQEQKGSSSELAIAHTGSGKMLTVNTDQLPTHTIAHIDKPAALASPTPLPLPAEFFTGFCVCAPAAHRRPTHLRHPA
jgi:hypothetical protein